LIQTAVRLSIIVPFHRNLDCLSRCLEGLGEAPSGAEIIIAADGAVDDCSRLAEAHGAKVVVVEGPSGPAVARNRAAAAARGNVLVFVDADVVVARDALARLAQLLTERPHVAAVFGAYDEEPDASNFASQYKNLAHSYIHQVSSPASQTFWAGFGAVRVNAFASIGGFDERFRRPCVEDIDLGYRLTAAGHFVLLDHRLRARHLKRWTIGSMIRSDVMDRGVPWTQLILRFGRFHDDLNLRSAYRACVALAYLLVALLALAPFQPVLLLPALGALVALILLGRKFYGYFIRQRGFWFTARLFPLHLLYHLYNGLSFGVGTLLYLARRELDLELPGSLPLSRWEPAAFEVPGMQPVNMGSPAPDTASALATASSNAQV
jgi:glycosyltransferase involved in cell wall biosynthesis